VWSAGPGRTCRAALPGPDPPTHAGRSHYDARVRPNIQPAQIAAGVAGTLIAVTLLGLALQRAGWQELMQALGRLSLAALGPALVCEAAVQASKALKWLGILGPARVRFGSALRAVLVGAASTHLVPLRLDEVLRAAVLARRERIPTATVLGTVAVDRVIEVFVAGSLLGLVAAVAGLPPWMRAGAAALWVGFATVLLGIVALRWAEEPARRWLAGLGGLGGAVADGLGLLLEGLRSLPRGKGLVLVLLGAAGEWLATLAFYGWMLRVFEVQAGLGAAASMALGNTVAYAVPNVPGALGTYEALQVGILEQVGLDRPEALALALAAHAVLMLPVTALGAGVGLIEWRASRGDA
jgi:uncharacterized protein (TIRG00374 family)